MEHRWYPRQAIDSPVTIFQEQMGIINAAVRNISANGMLVDMGQHALPKGAVVNLASADSERMHGKTLRLSALIVHTDEGVAGLMFIGNRRDVTTLLKCLDRQRPDEPFLATNETRDAFEAGEPARAAAWAFQ